MCWHRFVLLAIVLSSCREIEPVSPQVPFSGYQIEGIVTTSNGFPLEGVEIRLFYQYGNQFPAQDTGCVFVPDSVNNIQAAVSDFDGNIVRRFTVPNLFWCIPRNIWDGRDSTSALMKNGLYTIAVYFNGSLAKQYKWLVDARLTAVTNGNGQFLIPKCCLPVEEIVDLYDSLGAYDGTFDITSEVALRASTTNARRTVFLTLLKDRITRINIIL